MIMSNSKMSLTVEIYLSFFIY